MAVRRVSYRARGGSPRFVCVVRPRNPVPKPYETENLVRRMTLNRMYSRFLCMMLPLCPTACSAPSLLITPVSGRRELVESELSRDRLFARDKIAVLDVSGIIINANKPQLLGTGEHPVSLLLEELDAARADPCVKGVLLRINSPGGTVVASELMHNELTHFRKESEKPVVAIMMDVAASGGYYIACACDEILAHHSTITGSIGVIAQFVDVTGTMNLIGIKTDAVTSGPMKDAGSPLRAMRPEERQVFQNMVNEDYERFLQVVAAGRPKLSAQRVRELADGRVYTGQQATEHGLVDGVATMREAVEAVKRRAGVRSARLIAYHRVAEYKPNYYAAAPVSGGDFNVVKLDAANLPIFPTPRLMYLWQPGSP